MNIWYVNHYASPPGKGRGERPLHIARALKRLGHSPLIVAASHHHLQFTMGDSGPVEAGTEAVAGAGAGAGTEQGAIPFRFIATRAYASNGGLRRLLGMLDFAKGVGRLVEAVGAAGGVSAGRMDRPDVIICSSPHPFAFPAVQRLAQTLGARVVFEERDLWPLSLVEIAGVSRWHPLVLWMQRIVTRAYRNADAVVSLLPKARDHMVGLGMDPERFNHIPNGVSIESWEASDSELPAEHEAVFDRLRAEGKLIVVYTGSMGEPNALDQILGLPDAEGTEGGDVPFHFVLIGEGALSEALQKRVVDEGISYVSFLPAVPKERVRRALALADVCFIGWNDRSIYRFGISANKIFDYFLAGKPVLHAVNAGNDPVAEAEAGLSVAPYEPAELREALRAFVAMSAEERRAMGERGREFVLAHHNWEVLGRRYARVCEGLVASPPAAGHPTTQA